MGSTQLGCAEYNSLAIRKPMFLSKVLIRSAQRIGDSRKAGMAILGRAELITCSRCFARDF